MHGPDVLEVKLAERSREVLSIRAVVAASNFCSFKAASQHVKQDLELSTPIVALP
jgi:hypothetical protein